ncbi:MAG: DUF3192 domain-containing protein [Candidatus Omnitrophica bacterium]|nr:DUF3192 domain-containing protein [Candidatus Omnitrophota bacterium]
MYKKGPWIILLFMAGCVAATSAPEFYSRDWERPSIAMTNIDKVQLGMTSEEVEAIMGDTLDVGYRTGDSEGVYEGLVVKNPYYDEIIGTEEAQYRIVYYFTHIKKADGIVTSDELTPLVFEENRLIGIGQGFLAELNGRLK